MRYAVIEVGGCDRHTCGVYSVRIIRSRKRAVRLADQLHADAAREADREGSMVKPSHFMVRLVRPRG